MQKFAVNYYKDGAEDSQYCHVIECEGVEQALTISKLAACKGEYCILLTAESSDEKRYEELRSAVLDLANELYGDARNRLSKLDDITDSTAETSRECGMVSGLSEACGRMFSLLRKYN